MSLILILIGIILRIREYLFNRTMSFDEAVVALQLIKSSFSHLGNLYYNQLRVYHPYLFLFFTKLIIDFIKINIPREFLFRFIPLLSGILSVFAFNRLAKKILPKKTAIIANIFFVFSSSLILFSTDFREYSSDVLLFTVLYLLLIDFIYQKEIDNKQLIILAFLGAVAIWFSNPVFFLLFSYAAILIFNFIFKKKFRSLLKVMPVIVIWAINIIVNYFLFIKGQSHSSVLYLDFNQTFPPLPIKSLPDIQWYIDTLSMFFSTRFGQLWIFSVIFFIFGVIAFYKKQGLVLLILIGPLLTTFVVACFKWYPLTERHLLFTTPCVILIVSLGIKSFFDLSKKNKVFLTGFYLCLILLFISFFALDVRMEVYRPYEEQQNLKIMMRFIADNRKKDDWLYLYSSTVTPFEFYASNYGLDKIPYVAGSYRTAAIGVYLHDLLPLRGKKRVWAVFTHDYNWGPIDEEAFIIKYLDRIGQKIAYYPFGPSHLYLYDFSKK